MGHVTYEEQFVNIKTKSSANQLYSHELRLKFMAKCHPDFCKVCFSKMYEVDTPGGGTELKAELTWMHNDDRSPVFEPDGYGGASKVLVRPHVVLGTACGFESEGRVSPGPEPGAKLWHAMVWTSEVSICQDGMFEKGNEEQEQKVMEMMGIRTVAKDKPWPTCHFCPEPAVNEWEHNNEPICNDCFQSFTGHTFEGIEAEVANTLKPTIDESMPEAPLAPCGCETRSTTDLSVGWHRCGMED